ncbi:uncharacterized protein CLUP02_07707 [Colletotrichum lupini]|uniref:Uncharacterized protein n=1 Tax=Colletotrichum lupini TaxID=145971 RepID=A0A9Q8WGY2_9PEZI|nr:uncharacterized protein CLUP02_07707 [Colletotrichum lupini]UQC82220.1 hypothetical protein CLUP02_07707 [Colletotrichum lupini]
MRNRIHVGVMRLMDRQGEFLLNNSAILGCHLAPREPSIPIVGLPLIEQRRLSGWSLDGDEPGVRTGNKLLMKLAEWSLFERTGGQLRSADCWKKPAGPRASPWTRPARAQQNAANVVLYVKANRDSRVVIRGPLRWRAVLEASRGRMLSYHGSFLPIEYGGRSGRTSSITPIVVGIKVRLQTIGKNATPKPLDYGRVRWRWDEKAWRLGVGGSVMSCCFLPPLGSLRASELNLAASFFFSLRLSTLVPTLQQTLPPSSTHPHPPNSNDQRPTVNGPSSIRPFFPASHPYLMIRFRAHETSSSPSITWSLGPGLLDQYILNASPSRPVDVAAISYDISDTTTHLVQLSLRHLSNRHLTFFLPKIAVHAVPLPPTLPFDRFPFSVQNKSRNLRSVTPDPCPIDLRRWTEFGISDRLWTWQTPGRDLLGYHEVRLVPPLRWYTPICDAAYALIQGNRHLSPRVGAEPGRAEFPPSAHPARNKGDLHIHFACHLGSAMSTFTVIIAVLSTLWASSVGLLHGLILSYPPLLSTPSLESPTLNCSHLPTPARSEAVSAANPVRHRIDPLYQKTTEYSTESRKGWYFPRLALTYRWRCRIKPYFVYATCRSTTLTLISDKHRPEQSSTAAQREHPTTLIRCNICLFLMLLDPSGSYQGIMSCQVWLHIPAVSRVHGAAKRIVCCHLPSIPRGL